MQINTYNSIVLAAYGDRTACVAAADADTSDRTAVETEDDVQVL